MSTLFELDVLRATGWALLHFVWQGTALALVAALALHVIAAERPSLRYLVAAGVMAAAPLVLVATIIGELRAPVAPTGSMLIFQAPVPSPAQPHGDGSSVLALASGTAHDDRIVAVLAISWLIVVVLLALRLAIAWRRAGRLARTLSSLPVDAGVVAAAESAFARARARMRCTRRVRLACTSGGRTPAVVGWLRAIVLLPATVVSGLTSEQVELLLAHELAHIRRHDFIVNILQSGVETLFFFHPGIWWLSRQLRVERELACDEAVVAAYDRPADYGEALARLALLGGAPNGLALAATAAPLAHRIRRLFGSATAEELMPWRWMPALAAPGVLIAVLAGAQLASAQASMRGMLDAPSPVDRAETIARHEHQNRYWKRSVGITRRDGTGQLWSELRLGGRVDGLSYQARLQPTEGGDTTVVSLTAQVYGWRGRQSVELLSGGRVVAATASSDSLVVTFVRESGLNAHARATDLATRLGTTGVLREVEALGDAAVRATYLHAGVLTAPSASAREQLVLEALRIPNNAVGVTRVLQRAMQRAATPEELVRLVGRIPQVDGEAERLDLLVAAIHIGGRAPALHAAVERALASLPGEDARAAVRRALVGAP